MDYLKNHFSEKCAVVTGATGFIGSHLSRQLVSYGMDVVALIRAESDLWRLDDIRDNINLIEIDLSDMESVKTMIADVKPHFIFHFAIPPHGLLENEKGLENQIKVTNTHLNNLFGAIQDCGLTLDAFIHSCSVSVYENTEKNYILNEETPMKPNTLRGKLKLSQRNTCLELANTYNVPVRLARIFRAYGPMEVNTKLITKALDAYYKNKLLPIGNTEFKRDYIFIDDLVNGILLLAKENKSDSIELNFGGQYQYSAGDIVSHLEALLLAKIPKEMNTYPKNLYDQGSIIADCSKAKKLLGWEPTTKLEDGLSKTIHWYQSQTNG